KLSALLREFPIEDRRTTLPYDRPFPRVRTLEGDYYEVQLAEGRREALSRLSASCGIPMSALALTAVGFALHHVARDSTLNIGIAMMNRTAATMTEMGLRTNTVVMPIKVAADESVQTHLQRTSTSLFSIWRFSDVPLQDVVGKFLANGADLGVTPLFQ